MKRFLPLALLLTTACADNLPTGFTELDHKDMGSRVDYYYGAPGFNPQDSTAWRRVREVIRLKAPLRPEKGVLVLHFLDTTAYIPPTNGDMYGKSIMKKVIAQCTITPTGEQLFEADPFATKKYPGPEK